MADKKKSSKPRTAAPAKSSALKAAEAKAEQIVNSQSKNKDKDKSKAKKQNRVARYFKELKSELKKVVWPSRKTVLNNTAVVIAVMCIAAVVVAGLDSAYTALLKLLIDAAA